MSCDFLLSFLTSVHYLEVDQPLFTALELLKQESSSFPVHERVWRSATAARETPDLSVKKAWWLVLMALFPPMQEHVLATARDAATARAFVAWLQREVDALFGGKYSGFDRPLAEFVAASISSYCTPVNAEAGAAAPAQTT